MKRRSFHKLGPIGRVGNCYSKFTLNNCGELLPQRFMLKN